MGGRGVWVLSHPLAESPAVTPFVVVFPGELVADAFRVPGDVLPEHYGWRCPQLWVLLFEAFEGTAQG